MTAQELIESLKRFDPETPVLVSRDTFGVIKGVSELEHRDLPLDTQDKFCKLYPEYCDSRLGWRRIAILDSGALSTPSQISLSDNERRILTEAFEDFMECLQEGNFSDAEYFVGLLKETMYHIKRNNPDFD